MSSGVWIERDAGGHPCYIRKKEKQSQLSGKQQATELFLTLCRRPNPLLRVFRRENILVPTDTDKSPATEPLRPSSLPVQKNLDANGTPKKQKRDMNPRTIPVNDTSQPPTTYLLPQFGMLPLFHPPQFPPISSDNNRNNQDTQENQGTMVKSLERQPQQQYNAPPFPSMWGAMPGLHPMMPLSDPIVNFRAPPSLSYQGPGPAPALLSSQGFINQRRGPILPQTVCAEALKYRCHVCGRIRSAGYHQDHSVLPGQLPGKTICRDCRANIPDSDDDSIDDYGAARANRRRPRARYGPRAPSQQTDQSRTYTPQGSGAVRRTEQYSPDLNPLEGRFDRHASHRRRSPSPAARMTHNAYTPPQREHPRGIGTWENNHRRGRSREDNQWYEQGDPEGSHDRRNMYRPASSVSYNIHHQRSDPMTRTSDERGFAEFSNRPGCYEEHPSYQPSRSTSNGPPRRSRTVTVVEHVNHPDEFDPDPYHLFDEIVGVRNSERIRSTPAKSRGRNGNRQDYYDGGVSEKIVPNRPGIPGARLPGPPATVQQVRHSSLPTVMRSSSRSRYTVQMSHRHREGQGETNRNIDDYDWYDDKGMRVQVREI